MIWADMSFFLKHPLLKDWFQRARHDDFQQQELVILTRQVSYDISWAILAYHGALTWISITETHSMDGR